MYVWINKLVYKTSTVSLSKKKKKEKKNNFWRSTLTQVWNAMQPHEKPYTQTHTYHHYMALPEALPGFCSSLECVNLVVLLLCASQSHTPTQGCTATHTNAWHSFTEQHKRTQTNSFSHTCTHAHTHTHTRAQSHIHTPCRPPLLFREKSNYFLSLPQCLQKPQWGDSPVSQWNSLKQLLRE